MEPSALDPKQWAHYLLNVVSLWSTALHDPKTLLKIAPTEQELIDGIAFYLEMLVVSLIFTAPLILKHKSELGDKARMAASAGFSILSLAVCALAGDLGFRLFGGKGTFASSFLAMAYGFGPYGPFMTIASLLFFAAMPQRLQPYALSPVTAKKAGAMAVQDPKTNRALLTTGSILLFGALIVGYVAFLRCMITVHGSHGIRSVGSVVVSLIGIGILGALVAPINGLILPPPTEDIPESPGSTA